MLPRKMSKKGYSSNKRLGRTEIKQPERHTLSHKTALFSPWATFSFEGKLRMEGVNPELSVDFVWEKKAKHTWRVCYSLQLTMKSGKCQIRQT